MAPDGQKQQTQSIEISPFWENELKAMPFLSSKSPLLLPFLSALPRENVPWTRANCWFHANPGLLSNQELLFNQELLVNQGFLSNRELLAN